MKLKLLNNDYILFLPNLAIYVLIFLFKKNDFFIGDEERYVRYADNLLNGFYASTMFDDSFLWNGPGYPIIIALFKIIKIKLLWAKLSNCFFLYFGLIFLHKTLKKYSTSRKTYVIILILGLYYPFLQISIPFLITEALSFFLISFFSYHLITYSEKGQKKNKWFASITLGFLILTKSIFAYVLITLLIIYLGFYFFKKNTSYTKKYLSIIIIALFTTLPYQIYTYGLTKKVFYFSDAGGSSLYWMSTPYENELGDWHDIKTLNKKPKIYKNHEKFLTSIQDLSHLEKDEALKERAINNIIKHKQKFLKNWINNIGRLFFNHPYTIQNSKSKNTLRQYIWIFTHAFFGLIMLAGLFLSFFLSIKNYSKIEDGIIFLSLFSLIYFGGISLLSSYPRFLYIMLPCIIIIMFYNYISFKYNSL